MRSNDPHTADLSSGERNDPEICPAPNKTPNKIAPKRSKIAPWLQGGFKANIGPAEGVQLQGNRKDIGGLTRPPGGCWECRTGFAGHVAEWRARIQSDCFGLTGGRDCSQNGVR